MKKKYVYYFILIFYYKSMSAQFCKRDYLEKLCHYPIENKDEIIKQVDTFLYLMTKKDSFIKNWIDEEDINLWATPFDEISSYLAYSKFNKPTIVGIIDEEPNLYIVKILIEHFPDTTQRSFLGVYSLYLKYSPDNKSYKFKDYRTLNLHKNFDTLSIGNVLYFSKNINKLNKFKCKAFDSYNTKIARMFNTKPKKINYFYTKNSFELLNLYGWDIVYNMFYAPNGGYARFCGKSSKYENIIYSGNNDERYDHELIHLYYNELLESDTFESTLIIAEGIPTLLGGSSGKTYQELKSTLVKYINSTDTIKFKNHYINRSVNFQIDKHTNYIYVMGAFISEIYFKKEGINGLKKLANFTNQNLIQNICKDFGIKEEDLDLFLKKKLNEL